jgi:hypothetical protein
MTSLYSTNNNNNNNKYIIKVSQEAMTKDAGERAWGPGEALGARGPRVARKQSFLLAAGGLVAGGRVAAGGLVAGGRVKRSQSVAPPSRRGEHRTLVEVGEGPWERAHHERERERPRAPPVTSQHR